MRKRRFRILSKSAAAMRWMDESEVVDHPELQSIAPFLRQAVPRLQPTFTCPACSWTEAQFRETAMLGCGLCYTVFSIDIEQLLQKEAEPDSP